MKPKVDLKKLAPEALKILSDALSELGLTQETLVPLLPQRLYSLSGAPGAGKEHNGRKIRDLLGIVPEPVVMSNLLNSEECKAIKATGGMVCDKQATKELLRELTKPAYREGAMLDGFPRTPIQGAIYLELVRIIEETYHPTAARQKERSVNGTGIIILGINQRTSVKRQRHRGLQAIALKKAVEESGVGQTVQVRDTDRNPELMLKRYKTFKAQTAPTLSALLGAGARRARINANLGTDEVNAQLKRALASAATAFRREEAVRLAPATT
jgi:adenylate kinase family enzyme